ncbi:MAG: Protein-L-isoaspartate O-methyltransferase [Planctomycetaceae bacterium]|nr:Protein-L-isoaspartate O-methyltransferase [Planctomycetaceae bacterium]
MERVPLPPAISGSWEDVFHQVNSEDQLLIFESTNQMEGMAEPRGRRAVGVFLSREMRIRELRTDNPFPALRRRGPLRRNACRASGASRPDLRRGEAAGNLSNLPLI